MGSRFACQASAAFGLEGLVAEELRSLNMADVLSENGDVRFSADAEELFRCNLFLRYCDRVFVVMADQKCVTFDELFRLVNSIPWEDYVSGNEAFNISAKCARSRLMSPRDCQSIAKKALLERLKEKTKLRIFPENGPSFPVLVSVHSDRVRILLNTSGDALSRRGYRTWNGEAPLRETLAAALVRLSPWKPGMPLYDPCCGTGTILTEAALIASHRCPGISRHFAMEQFHFCQSLDFTFLRKTAEESFCPDLISDISGSDIDPGPLKLALRHVHQAGLDGRISLSVLPLQEVSLSSENGVFICNPPYGERLSDQAASRTLYRDLHALKRRHPSWSLCAISSDPGFERAFGLRADKKRRLYNGRLECTYYIYYGTRKPVSC